MKSPEEHITQRFIEFGQTLFGKDHGWQKKYADALQMSSQQMTDILSGRSPVGPKIREKLRDLLGCDIEWLMTGKKGDGKAKKEEPFTAFHAPAGMDSETRKTIQKLIDDISELDYGDVERARQIVKAAFKKKK